jgi:hypothetical protein
MSKIHVMSDDSLNTPNPVGVRKNWCKKNGMKTWKKCRTRRFCLNQQGLVQMKRRLSRVNKDAREKQTNIISFK